MKLSEYKNEEAIDLLADILEPTALILANQEVQQAVKAKATKVEVVKIVLKNCKKEIIEIFARLNGQDVKDYSCNIFTLTKDLLDILSDEVIKDFFASQLQSKIDVSSGSVTENIKAKEQ